jgi:tetratricopeptide (TPR) repeat protein
VNLRRIAAVIAPATLAFAIAALGGCLRSPGSAPETTVAVDQPASGPSAAPPSVPDGSATQALLMSGQYADLDARFAAIQHAYEAGAMSDVALRDAFRAFYSTNAALEAHYAEWVQKHPTSYVAHLARGIYYKKVGIDRRGEASAAETSAAQFDAMRTAFDAAAEDLYASMKLSAKPLLSYLHAIDLNNYVSEREECRRLLDASLKVDPHNFVVRRKFIVTLETRWGGSADELASFIEESRRAGTSADHLRELESVAAENEAWVLKFRKNDQSGAADAYLRASELSPSDGCLKCAADSLMKAERFKEAAALYTTMLASDPDFLIGLSNRGYSYLRLGQVPEAIRDLERASALGDASARTTLGTVYLAGGPVPQNRDKGIEYLKQAADQGYQPAKAALATAQRGPAGPGASSPPP